MNDNQELRADEVEQISEWQNNERIEQRTENHEPLIETSAADPISLASDDSAHPEEEPGGSLVLLNLSERKIRRLSSDERLVAESEQHLSKTENNKSWFKALPLGQKLVALVLIGVIAIGALGAAGEFSVDENGEGGVLLKMAESVGLKEPSAASKAKAARNTLQLSKEYIYAGSRMLAVEDYGLATNATPTPTPGATPIPVGTAPTGKLDSVTVTNNNSIQIKGWSFDPSNSNASNFSFIYIDGPIGSGTLVGSVIAFQPRPDVNSLQNITGDHGFVFNLNAGNSPSSFDGNQHSVYVYTQDLNGNNKTLLYNAPLTFQVGSAPTPTPTSVITPTPTPTPAATPTPNPDPVTGCQYGYTSLGGIISSDPTASVFGSSLFVFARGTDGAVYYQTTQGGNFSGWNGLGGVITTNPRSAVVSGALYVEAMGTDSNNYYQATSDGVYFSGWINGTVNAQTNATASFNGNTYTFVKGTGSQPHLCVKVQ